MFYALYLSLLAQTGLVANDELLIRRLNLGLVYWRAALYPACVGFCGCHILWAGSCLWLCSLRGRRHHAASGTCAPILRGTAIAGRGASAAALSGLVFLILPGARQPFSAHTLSPYCECAIPSPYTQ